VTPLLELDSVSVRYGSLAAVSSVSLTLEQRSVLVVLGANGAGKSSLARAIAGLVPISGGTITFGGADLVGLAPHRVRRQGVAYVPERGNVFPSLTVDDNLRLAVRAAPRRDRAGAIEAMFTTFPVLAGRRRQVASSLSGGERQMLALARALAVKPTILVVDELSLGLAPIVVDRVFDALDGIRRDGVSIVLIEQFVHRALGFGDQCVILKRGKAVWQGDTDAAHEQVLETYLGDAAAV
jgi:branched-chain amino acid transport system ATP-binding protein